MTGSHVTSSHFLEISYALQLRFDINVYGVKTVDTKPMDMEIKPVPNFLDNNGT